MCYDMCLRALDDALQTFGSMRYRRAQNEQADPVAEAAKADAAAADTTAADTEAADTEAADSEVAALVEQLRQIRCQLGRYEGAHLDETVKCNACNVYHHHNHNKTEWRGEGSRDGYDDETKWAAREDGARYVMRPPSPYADM